MYKNIICPETQKSVNIKSNLGKSILKRYINSFLKGGAQQNSSIPQHQQRPQRHQRPQRYQRPQLPPNTFTIKHHNIGIQDIQPLKNGEVMTYNPRFNNVLNKIQKNTRTFQEYLSKQTKLQDIYILQEVQEGSEPFNGTVGDYTFIYNPTGNTHIYDIK